MSVFRTLLMRRHQDTSEEYIRLLPDELRFEALTEEQMLAVESNADWSLGVRYSNN